MAVNPMQKKARNSFLLGMIITLLVCAIIGGLFYVLVIRKNEQKEQLITKINEKYGTEKKVSDMNATYIPRFKLIDVVKPYIIPVIATTVLILIYMAIRFRKLGTVKVLSHAITLTAIAELLYFALIAITRYPVNRLLMPVAIVIYITILKREHNNN